MKSVRRSRYAIVTSSFEEFKMEFAILFKVDEDDEELPLNLGGDFKHKTTETPYEFACRMVNVFSAFDDTLKTALYKEEIEAEIQTLIARGNTREELGKIKDWINRFEERVATRTIETLTKRVIATGFSAPTLKCAAIKADKKADTLEAFIEELSSETRGYVSREGPGKAPSARGKVNSYMKSTVNAVEESGDDEESTISAVKTAKKNKKKPKKQMKKGQEKQQADRGSKYCIHCQWKGHTLDECIKHKKFKELMQKEKRVNGADSGDADQAAEAASYFSGNDQ